MITVAAGLIERDGKILIARRRNRGAHGHKWEFPGGKVEPNETPEECVRRELQEELGIEVTVGALFCVSEHDYPDFSIRLSVYNIVGVVGDPIALEHDEVCWVGREEMGAYDFPEADLPVVEKLASGDGACPFRGGTD